MFATAVALSGEPMTPDLQRVCVITDKGDCVRTVGMADCGYREQLVRAKNTESMGNLYLPVEWNKARTSVVANALVVPQCSLALSGLHQEWPDARMCG